jgi:predicted dehydrogenase
LSEVSSFKLRYIGFSKDRARAEGLARRFDVSNVTESYEEILNSDVDLVVLATPVKSHYDLGLRALRAGKNIVVDKPLCLNAREAWLLAKQSGTRRCMTFFQWRHHAGFKVLRWIVNEGAIGRIHHIDLQFRHDFLAGDTYWPWRHLWGEAAAGAFADQGVHLLDLACWLKQSTPKVEAAFGRCLYDERIAVDGARILAETEDFGQAALSFGDGALASIFVSRVASGSKQIRATLTGDRGTVSLVLNPETSLHKIRVDAPTSLVLPNYSSDNPYRLWLEADAELFRSCASLVDGAVTQELLDAVIASLRRQSSS